MEQIQAMQKFWNIPVAVGKLIYLLYPMSTLRLVQSGALNKDILQKSLSRYDWEPAWTGTTNMTEDEFEAERQENESRRAEEARVHVQEEDISEKRNLDEVEDSDKEADGHEKEEHEVCI